MDYLTPVLNYLATSQRPDSSTTNPVLPGGSSTMASKFAALRQKLEGRMSNKTKQSRKRRRDFSSASSSSSSSSSSNSTTASTVPVLHLKEAVLTQRPSTKSIVVSDASRSYNSKAAPDWHAIVRSVQQYNNHVFAFCALMNVQDFSDPTAANHDTNHTKTKTTRATTTPYQWYQQKRSFYILVPGTASVWCVCMIADQRTRQGAMQAAITHAIGLKQAQVAFGKVAKDERRLMALVQGDQGRLEHCFKKTPKHVRALLQMDQEAGFSITDEVTADQITEKVVALIGYGRSSEEKEEEEEEGKRGGKKNVMVCDLTACVGGNVLSFGKQFDYVYGIEIDPTRHRMLQNNVRVMHDYRTSATSATSGRSGRNFQRSQIHTACGDAVLLLQPTPPGNILVQDFLSQWSPSSVGVRIDEMIYFLDPPWGGLNYKNQSSISLTLGATPIATVVALCLKVW